MKKDYLLPFLRASEEISAQYFNVPVESSNISLEKNLDLNSDVLFIIGIRGELSGVVLFGMSKKDAINFSTHVLKEQHMESVDGYGEWSDISKSVLLEYGNQVAGFVTNLYGEKGYVCDLTTPSFIERERVADIKKHSVRFEMNNEIGHIDVKLQIQGK